mmetsp:Transcript_67940/g.100801  ORF Transcript_67940/g.100801 Transcript_67940/m.100801 type:complete len:508 (-) Transcript_67940:91-1614(-)
MDLKCPPGVDESIFLSLPPDVQRDVVAQYTEQQPRKSRSDTSSRDEKSSARTPDRKSPKKNAFLQGTGVIGAVRVGPDNNDTAEYVTNRKMKSLDQRVNAKRHASAAAAAASPLQHAVSPLNVEVEEEQSTDLPFGGELDPEMLAALPEDIRREVIESYWEEQERKTKSAKDKSFVEPPELKVSTPSSSVTSSIQTSPVYPPQRSRIEIRSEEDAYIESLSFNQQSPSKTNRRSRNIISPLSLSDLENEPSLKKPPTIDRNIAFPLSASVAQSAVCRRPEPTPMETMKCKYVGGYDERRRRSGKGELRWENGDTFRGLFADGLRCGPGTLKLHDGSSYEGNWKNDEYDGYGVRKFPNGYIYAGQFQNGRSCGHGKCTFPNGDSYEGGWIDGLMDGLGKYVHKVNGDIYEGMYHAGKRDGPGRYRHRNRRTDVVQYVNNERVGEAVRWSKCSKKAWLLQGKEVMRKLSKEDAMKLQDKICGSHIEILDDNVSLRYRMSTPPRKYTTRY